MYTDFKSHGRAVFFKDKEKPAMVIDFSDGTSQNEAYKQAEIIAMAINLLDENTNTLLAILEDEYSRKDMESKVIFRTREFLAKLKGE